MSLGERIMKLCGSVKEKILGINYNTPYPLFYMLLLCMEFVTSLCVLADCETNSSNQRQLVHRT